MKTPFPSRVKGSKNPDGDQTDHKKHLERHTPARLSNAKNRGESKDAKTEGVPAKKGVQGRREPKTWKFGPQHKRKRVVNGKPRKRMRETGVVRRNCGKNKEWGNENQGGDQGRGNKKCELVNPRGVQKSRQEGNQGGPRQRRMGGAQGKHAVSLMPVGSRRGRRKSRGGQKFQKKKKGPNKKKKQGGGGGKRGR